VVVRVDATSAKPEIYEALEEQGVKYAIRLPPSDSLERDIVELLTRRVRRLIPQGGTPASCKSFLYQCKRKKWSYMTNVLLGHPSPGPTRRTTLCPSVDGRRG
jgi:hypothetical protein